MIPEVPRTYNSSGFYDPAAMAEAVRYGFYELRMRDAEIGRELNVSRERIRQVRQRIDLTLPHCECGARLHAKAAGKCRKCEVREERAPLCSAGCGRHTYRNHHTGTCAVCGNKYYRLDSVERQETTKIQARTWRNKVTGPVPPTPESSRVMRLMLISWPVNKEFTSGDLIRKASAARPDLGFTHLQASNVIGHARVAGRIERLGRLPGAGHPALWRRTAVP